ncbi:MAG: SIS domain-containing protein [Rhizobiaceae bacterium]|nr:SIS domain-containing protein [Rhizobiaceae bacterium]
MAEDLFRTALDELDIVLQRIDLGQVDDACAAIGRAGTVVVYGCGREALQMKGFAMRLFHIGVPVAVVGDMTAPALGQGDLFLVTAGPGELSTVTALMTVARNAGAHNLLLTAEPDSSAGRLADSMILVPAQTMARDQGDARTSVLPMGSVYEGALFMLFEVMILKLKGLLAVSPEAMRARHTNME